MKKLIICLFAIAISFTSYAQGGDDTTYLKHKNINYIKINKDSGRLFSIKNIDAKNKNDRKKALESGKTWFSDYNSEYSFKISIQMSKDATAIFLKYVKDNFTKTEKKKIIEFVKYGNCKNSTNTTSHGDQNRINKLSPLTMFIWVEKDASFAEMSFDIREPDFLDIFKDTDIANLDMLVRESLVIERLKSGQYQTPQAITGAIPRKAIIEFLENDLKEK